MKTQNLPEKVIQGEQARLFSVLSTKSKEGRTTATLLACLTLVHELAKVLLSGVGQRLGARAKISSFTEVVFQNQPDGTNDRPDGLMIVSFGKREWKALIEAKVGAASLQVEQIERYRAIAKDNGIDCVITISNQFATSPDSHPLTEVRRSRSKIPVFHWSWMHILITADLLLSTEVISDNDQKLLLNELHRFLTHESTEVRGFERMPKEWTDLNKLVSSGGVIQASSAEARTVMYAWHQETRNLALVLSRLTETVVGEKLLRKHQADPLQRQKDELAVLKDRFQLGSTLNVDGAAAPVEVVVDLMRRCVDVGMSLRAPEDRKTTKARLNWLLRQIKTENLDDLFVRLHWPRTSEPTQHLISELRENLSICDEGKHHLVTRSFHVFYSKRLGGRFAQQSNFINDLEEIVPEFYGEVGEHLRAWQRPAPRIRTEALKDDENIERESNSSV